MRSFSEGLAAAAFKHRWGAIDKYNKTIIPFEYERLSDFGCGTSYVEGEDFTADITKDDILFNYKVKIKHEYDYEDAKELTWDALTDGQYGDMPDWF